MGNRAITGLDQVATICVWEYIKKEMVIVISALD